MAWGSRDPTPFCSGRVPGELPSGPLMTSLLDRRLLFISRHTGCPAYIVFLRHIGCDVGATAPAFFVHVTFFNSSLTVWFYDAFPINKVKIIPDNLLCQAQSYL